MLQVQILAVTVALTLLLVVTEKSAAQKNYDLCTLDGMKEMAANACEDFFQYDLKRRRERSRRSIEDNELDHVGDTESGIEHKYDRNIVMVRRNNYPAYGYLVMDHHLAKNLQKLNDTDYSITRMKPSRRRHIAKLMHQVQKNSRHKRQSRKKHHVPYCCQHECRAEHFC